MFYFKFWRVFVLLCLAVFIEGCVFSGADEKYYENSVYCQIDNDCQLYDCANCGNSCWIEKNIKDDLICEKQSRVISCKCVENVCKRKLRK
ncbi:hypothetical protein KAU09_04025 [Candidatus Parcubacteria bacterium]|nr:hypothetical protein [Candidatus Parcubacteria bacterium]